jgi:hypothetical protein
MKITLIQSQKREFKGQDGTEIEGYQNAGYVDNGTLIEFWSQNDHGGAVVIATGYNQKTAIDLDIRPKVFARKVKYSEWNEI